MEYYGLLSQITLFVGALRLSVDYDPMINKLWIILDYYPRLGLLVGALRFPLDYYPRINKLWTIMEYYPRLNYQFEL